VTPELLKGLEGGDWSKRQASIEDLLMLPEDMFLPHLEKAIGDHANANLRNGAMEAYRSLGRKAVPSLLKLLRDEDSEIRTFAANILGDIGDREAVPYLIRALKDTDENVKVASAESLGKIGDNKAVRALAQAIFVEGRGVGSPWPALAAMDALAKIGGQEALEILTSCVKKRMYIEMALDALERIGGREAIKAISEFIEEEELKELALKAIVNIAERLGDRFMPEYFMRLAPVLLEIYKSPKFEVRKAALIALSWAEDIRAVFALIDSIAEEDLQEYALKGLLKLGKKSVQAIIDAIKEVDKPQRATLARFLFIMGEYEALLQFAADGDPRIRLEAALAAGKLSSKRAGKVLAALARDPEREVRAAARKKA
jgi:HEAT repeat protein